MATSQKSRGGRVDFSSLVGSVGDRSPVDATIPVDGQFRPDVPLSELVANPRNPRSAVGDLADLATIAERQLQPGTVVTSARWLDLWPEDVAIIGSARWVVVNGCRRLAASEKYGRKGMDVVVQDSLASSKEAILWASIVENLDRQDFDVIEEAEAVNLLVTELGSATKAAQKLGRSEGWISQRRALLKLEPELREKLRSGDLAIRDARALAQIPSAEQVAKWASRQQDPPSPKADDKKPRRPSDADKQIASRSAAVRALTKLKSDPQSVAEVIREALSEEDVRELVNTLQDI